MRDYLSRSNNSSHTKYFSK